MNKLHNHNQYNLLAYNEDSSSQKQPGEVSPSRITTEYYIIVCIYTTRCTEHGKM